MSVIRDDSAPRKWTPTLMFALTLAVAVTAPGVRVDVPARLAQLLVLDFQSLVMFDAARSKLALASNVSRLSPKLPNEHHSTLEQLFGGFSV
jgi:hypothetical protein